MREHDTIHRAETVVIRKETKDLNRITDKLNCDPTNPDLHTKLFKEKQRLDPDDKFDHEDLWYATGVYTKGVKPKK